MCRILTMNTSSPSLKPDVTLSLTLPSTIAADDAIKPEERGIKLIQLLLSCANHASSGNLHRADVCLRRISQLSSVSGDSMQRLAARFAAALAVRVVKRWPGLYKALNHSGPANVVDLDRARSIFAQAFPYLGFSYAVITQTLIKSLSTERIIHIVDLGSGDPKLYIPLLQSFTCGPFGPAHMKISCVSANKALLEELGNTLVKVADGLDMPFQFNPVNVSLGELTQDMLKVRLGEALAFVSILNLHVLLAEDDRVDAHFGVSQNNSIKDCKRVGEFLAMVRSMSPKVMFVVEQEANHNINRLVDRFVEGLHYYSAVFDSIDSTFGSSSPDDRIALEEMFGSEIENIVACEGMERKARHERCARWLVRFTRAGFKPVHLWATEYVNGLVESYRPIGYKVFSQRPSLMICWHDRPIYAVSAWTCLNF